MPDQTWPMVAITLVTYTDDADGPRAHYAHKTLRTVLEKVRYPGPIHLHIADDGSPQLHRDRLYEIGYGDPNISLVSVSDSHRGGYGASMNIASQSTHATSKYQITIEDDWELLRPLPVDALVADMEADRRVNMIRLGYLGLTNQMGAELIRGASGDVYALLDPQSADGYVFAGHPRIERTSHQKAVGPWPVGLTPGATELTMCGQLAARTGVAWPMDLVHPRGDLFAHIGTVEASREHAQ